MPFFFIKSLSSPEKAILIKEIICKLTTIGAKLINITFDGLESNFAACRLLGASFLLNDFRPYFKNPIDQTKVHIMLDACHMLKLIRNCLGSEKILIDGETGKKIEWNYFENLENYRINRNFVTHKVTKKHIEWFRNKMNVKLAVQLLSKSVGDSLRYLANKKCCGFDNAETTADFVDKMDKLFNIFNSTNVMPNNLFKSAIDRNSAESIFEFLDKISDYLKSLVLRNQTVIQTRKRTGFKGFLINITNIKSIYDLFVKTGLIENIPTFYLSQDLLESFFGRVRSLNGNAENPTVTQFTSAFRKILVQNEIKSSNFANCIDKLKILSVSSRHSDHMLSSDWYSDLNFHDSVEILQREEDAEHLETIFANENDFLMDCCEEVTIASIAGSIEQKIMEAGRFECSCKCVLLCNEKVTADLTVSVEKHVPCISTVHICKITNIYFNICRNQINFDYSALVQKVMDSIEFESVFTKFFECDQSHKMGFVQYIVEEFIRLQANYIARNITLVEQKILCRKLLQKKVHFLGQ